IPAGSRCCTLHTVGKRLIPEAFQSLVPHKAQYRRFSPQTLINLLKSYRTRLNSNKHLDFDECMCLTDADYIKLTGFTRAQHAHILSHIPPTSLKNSATRSARSALAYLLMKLKLGLSDSVLASMVGVDSKRQMSRIISEARVAVTKHFVPRYLGLAHLTRQDVIDKHTSPIANRLLTEGRDPCILVLDGTYLYIQKSRNNAVQRKTYSLQKKRSLIKPMVMVTTTGYIVTIFGPFFSDFHNNDASILKHVMLNNYEDILNWTKENDIMILDRGFRDSLGVLKALGIDTAMPSFLGKNRRQFDAYDANRSRFVTKLRWVVEGVNARLKRFRWLSQTIQNSSLPSVPDFMAIVAALNNCFHVPMVVASPEDDDIVRRMNQLLSKSNILQERLIQDNLQRHNVWRFIDIDNLFEPFPVLSLDDIRSITLGVYQLKRARSYAEEHSDCTELTDPDLDFPIEACTEHGAEDIIRLRFRSAHKSCTYHTYIQFDSTQVIAWYCTCIPGPRTVGCCSHIAAAIWFLGYERYQSTTNRQPSSTNTTNIHYADNISDFEPSSDEEDNSYIYTSE
ncbi:unnamed protein product, partial [Rotaria magnacalcarata]